MSEYQITLRDLVNKISAAIQTMSVKNPNRILLDQLGQVVVQQQRQIQLLTAELEKSRVVLTDG